MKRFAAIFLLLLSFLGLNTLVLGMAEAAKVAVIPLRVNEAQVERAGDFNSYYWDIMIDKFVYPDFNLIDDDAVAQVVPEEGLKDYDQATLTDIAGQTGADIVVAMRLDKVADKAQNFRREPTLLCTMQGEFASYNRVTGKYFHKKINYREEIEEVLTYRTDWQQRAFATNLRRYLNRTVEVK